MEITYWSNDPLSSKVIGWFREEKARHALTSLTLTPTMNNPLVSFGRGGSHVLPPMRYVTQADVTHLFKTLFESTVLFFDIETHNAELKHSLPRDEFVRLVQWAWGARGEVQVSTNVQDLIDQFDKAELIVAHNGHAFDFGVTMGDNALDLAAQRRLFDTMVYANLVVPAPDKFTDRNGRTHTQWMGGQPKIVPHSMKWLSLDNLCYQLGLGGKLGDLQELAKKHNPPKTAVSKLDYSLIPTDDPEFLAYAEQDIHALRDLYYALMAKQEPAEYDWREQFKIAIDAQMSRNGFKVDTDLATRRIKEAEERKSRLLARLQAEYGLPSEGKSPWATTAGKAAQIAAIQAMGIDPYTHPGWPQGKTGPSLGKDPILAYVPDKEFAEALVQLKGDRGLAQQALEYVGPDGKVHIDITALQRSGRKCIPTTHKLLTKRGLLHIEDVVVGDETLDVRNRWVPVKEIHRYSDAPVTRWGNRAVMIESTPEHRWVQHTEASKRKIIEPLDLGVRRVLQLTPDCYPYDPHEKLYPQGMTERERFAAIIGLLVTDGRCTIRTDTSYDVATFHIYQTEGKFYQQMKSLLKPEWIASDNITMKGRSKTPHHDIRLYSKFIRPMLEAEGLEFSEGLRHSESLFRWIRTLNQHETLAFLTSVYLADGRTASLGKTISTKNPVLREVFQFAAFRCGFRSKYRTYGNSRDNFKQGVLHLNEDRVSTRNLKVVQEYRTDVWCVTTETGTFTAYSDIKDYEFFYVTGNSVGKPSLGTWSAQGAKAREKEYFIPDSPDELLVELDFSNADARAVAAMSGDPAYQDRVNLSDAHTVTAKMVFGEELHATDPAFYRQKAKAASLGWGYRMRAKRMSASLDITPEWANKVVSWFDTTYSGVVRWQERATELGERDGYIRNAWGRRMVIDTDETTGKSRAFTQAPALLGQSTTTEILTDALIRLYNYDKRFIRWLKVTIHDAVVFSIPKTELDWAVPKLVELLTFKWKGVDFPVAAGEPAENWWKAGH